MLGSTASRSHYLFWHAVYNGEIGDGEMHAIAWSSGEDGQVQNAKTDFVCCRKPRSFHGVKLRWKDRVKKNKLSEDLHLLV